MRYKFRKGGNKLLGGGGGKAAFSMYGVNEKKGGKQIYKGGQPLPRGGGGHASPSERRKRGRESFASLHEERDYPVGEGLGKQSYCPI